MKTVYFRDPTKENIEAAAKIIRDGGLLAIPTETVYGLGADALNEDAVLRIFLAKGRPQDNPLIIHVPDSSWLERYCENVPPEAYALAEKFWPGPLTMILPRKPIVPLRTTGGLETVGVRCPNHPITRAVIAAADVIKPESPEAVKQLRNMGIRVVMLTGDNERTAKAVGAQAGVDEVIAGVLPDGKEAVIRSLKEQGKVAMVGDGINDAPALTRADIGIAIGAGTDIAIDAADVVLMNSRLTDVPAAVRLSRASLRNIKENLFWAFIYNTIGIPLAAGVFVNLFGWSLDPMFGAAAMSLSSFCVVSNALRLNFVKVHSPAHDRKIHHISNKHHKEEKSMEVTMKIEGMMCGHCEAAVKKALEALPTVESAEVSHEKGLAVVKLSAETPFETLKKAVEDKDYKVIG